MTECGSSLSEKDPEKMAIDDMDNIFIPINKVKHLANFLVKNGETVDPNKSLHLVQTLYDFEGKGKRAVLCGSCAVCIGTKRCSKCSKAYYCSRECQLAAWPCHKKVCGK